MANEIRIKSSGNTGNVPSSLANGELAINYADGDVYYKNASNVIVKLGTIPDGGLEGQILSKTTDTDFDTAWIDNYANEIRYSVKNDSGSQINKFTVVAANGAAGDTIRAIPFVNDGSIASEYILGVAAENIPDGETGYVSAFGPLMQLNTEAWSLGTILYSSSATPGLLTSTKPSAPSIDLPLAIVTKVASNGRIFVRSWSQGQKLEELYDANISSPASGEFLKYDGSLWINAPAPVVIQNTAPTATDILWVDTSESGDQVLPPGGGEGQVLAKNSASDYDTTWITPGLVLVASQEIGNAVSSATVTDCFSSDYDNYKVLLVGGAGSTNAGLAVTIGSASTGYYCVRRTSAYATPTTDNGGADDNGSQFTGVGFASADGCYLDLQILSPYLAAKTFINGYRIVGSSAGTVMGYLDDTSSHSSFTITPASGTLTGGTIRVYGYVQ